MTTEDDGPGTEQPGLTASENVAANVRRLRTGFGWSLASMSQRMAAVGHPMGVAVLSKLELGERGIDVEDLVALAEVLDVAPSHLMRDPRAASTTAVSNLVDDLRAIYEERDKVMRRVEALDGRVRDTMTLIRDLVGGRTEAVLGLAEALRTTFPADVAADLQVQIIEGDV